MNPFISLRDNMKADQLNVGNQGMVSLVKTVISICETEARCCSCGWSAAAMPCFNGCMC